MIRRTGLAPWVFEFPLSLDTGITGALTCPLDTIRARTMNEAGRASDANKMYDGPLQVPSYNIIKIFFI